jgi:hypothetical protein
MVSTPVLAAIVIPIPIYLVIAAVIPFVLGCAMYVCIIKLRQFANRTCRKVWKTYHESSTIH